jgi:hypothetical protein
MMAARLWNTLPAMLLLLFGAAVVAGGMQLESGSLTRMGPGFMPMLLGALLVFLATALLLQQWFSVLQAMPKLLPARPLLCAGASLLLWALLAERSGFIPASITQLLLAYAAMPRENWFAVLGNAVGVSLLAFVLFVLLLGLPLRAVG